MGTNISKGLKDRRSRSSTSLYKPKHLRPGKFFTPARITRQERYKLSGSLPNFLDIKSQPPPSDFREREIYAENNNELSKDSKLLEIERFEKESLTRDYSMCISEKSPPPAPPPQLLARSPSTTENENENEKHPVAPKRRLSSSKRNSHNKAAYVTDATFDVTLNKGHGGLGLSISGGKNSEDQSCGLISIKKLFPHQTAWQSGRLLVGDILLAVNGVPLTGLTNFEALEVLRKSANPVTLTVRRSPDSQPRSSEPPFQPKSPESTRPDQFDQSSINQSFSFNKSKISSSSPPASLLPNFEDGPTEFDITLKKVNGSLGFTLRKEEETSILGHFVRALVKEPALSDGRIKPGDRIESVNGVDLSALTHEKAVAFLRQCGEEVQLRLHRDSSQTPVSASALSPTHGYRPPKPILRKEAIEMLSDLKKSESSPSISRQRGKSSQALKEQIKKSGFRSSIDDPDCTDGVETSSLPNDDGSYSFNPFMHDSLVINNPNFGTPRSLDLSQIPDSVASMPPTLTQPENHPEFGDAPSSMPALPPEQSSESTFAYNLPAYQSTHLPTTTKSVESRKLSERSSEHDLSFASLENESKGGLLKWKGIMFTPEDQMDGSKDPSSTPSHSPSPSPSPLHSFDDKQLIKVELTRSWNSRLGFSLTSAKHGEGATISTIHPNSVAAKNGQLQSGDLLVKVNNENVSNMSTSEVIELLRRVRGAVVIYVHRHE